METDNYGLCTLTPAPLAASLPYAECLYGDCYDNAFFYPVSAPNFGHYDSQHEPAFIRKRNERERQRVKFVNEGYEKLRQHLPQEYAQKRLSKVETLRAAIKHIKHLQACLRVDGAAASGGGNMAHIPK
uniref:Achaete-scute family bHLH transcription factor 3 n=1 Tax=Erpetoichthys calabaricus TaxID=27687 RepID=A0A8C4SNT9_ERPCA